MSDGHHVDVAGLDHGDHLHVAVSIPIDLNMDLAAVSGAVPVDANITSTPAGFTVLGIVVAQLAMRCHRCLQPVDDEVPIELDDLVTDDPDDGEPTVVDDRINLEPLVRDAIGLAIPLRPLCREDCKGLCPVCGSDLNSDPCGGHDEVPQNPFSVLEHLLDPE